MVKFILSNYEKIISLALLLVSFISSLAFARKEQKTKSLLQIVSQIPEIVSQIESLMPNGFGDVKLGFVLRSIEKLCASSHVTFDKAFMTEQVEKVLAAPSCNKSSKEV